TEAHIRQLFVPNHKVADNNCHLGDKLPILIFLFSGLYVLFLVKIFSFSTILLDPGDTSFIFLWIVDTKLYPAQYFRRIYIFVPHAQIILKEIGIYDRSRDT